MTAHMYSSYLNPCLHAFALLLIQMEKKLDNTFLKKRRPRRTSCAAGSSFGFGKKRGRKEEKGQRLTASAVFHEYRIISDYDRGITDLRTILGEFMNYLEAFFLR